MSGIYIHIPFCKNRCSYCDFYSSTRQDYIKDYANYVIRELFKRSGYLNDPLIETIYFGGGTPSLLTYNQLELILNAIKEKFLVSADAEITLEANPDDLNQDYLNSLLNLGINRLSIGIQSFDDNILKEMNRRHKVSQAIQSVHMAQKTGFKNISVDLIYGWPNMNAEQWTDHLNQVVDLGIQHISAYHLTYHTKTPLGKKLNSGLIHEVSEEESFNQYKQLVDFLQKYRFEQYEISNFSLPGFHSRHNISYWNQKEYLGLGPSAHSFNQSTRYWNSNSINQYILALEKNTETGEFEHLTEVDKYNDLIITSLRTKNGVRLDSIRQNFGPQYVQYLLKNAEKYFILDYIKIEDQSLRLTKKGMFVSDMIMEDLITIKSIEP